MFNIALNTFRELVRSRMLVLILVFSVVLILFSLVLASLSLGQTERLVLDFGFSMIELSGLVAVVFVGGQMLYREIEGRTIYLILSKPIGRKEFVLGKFFGFALVLLAIFLAESAVLTGLLFFKGMAIGATLAVAAAFSYLKLLTTFAVVLFFTTFASPILSILFSLAVFVSSHSAQAVLDVAEKTKNAGLGYFGQALSVVLPNFESLSHPKSVIATAVELPSGAIGFSALHALAYLALILTFACLIFERKNFENS